MITPVPVYFFFTNFVFITYHNGPVIQIEENVPPNTPTISGIANSLIELTPSTYSTASIIKVVAFV